jgi:hypothetical protein
VTTMGRRTVTAMRAAKTLLHYAKITNDVLGPKVKVESRCWPHTRDGRRTQPPQPLENHHEREDIAGICGGRWPRSLLPDQFILMCFGTLT